MKRNSFLRKSKQKFAISLALLLIASISLLSAVAILASADIDAQAKAEDVLTYDGLSARTKGYSGVRSIYSVDREAVAALEDAGYRVAYGALMGIGTYGGQTINTTRTLAVSGNFNDGFTAAGNNTAALVIYATGAPAYATGIHLDDTDTSFAYTTVFSAQDTALYDVELVYAAFVSVTDENGNEILVYDYAEGDTFGAEGSLYGAATSVSEIADHFVNHYTEDGIKAYYYNQNETLRFVLTTCEKEISSPTVPLAVNEVSEEAALAKTLTVSYMNEARIAYKTAAYADYTTSIIANYSTTGSAYNDRPNAVSLSWNAQNGGAWTYVVTLATDADFTQNVRTVATTATSCTVYNLLTGSTYYWTVCAQTADGYSYTTEASAFQTANTVRWIYADGVRNVRDLGGWNGLNQGLVYRGSELNLVGSHGLQITEEGKSMMVDVLGIKTDLDFRAASENGSYGTSSPLGDSVTWKNCAIGNFLSAFNSSYESTMRTFIDYDNYPIYMHCWGGADRTGTVAFMLQGLCGASEEDLAIDLENTSFSIFGYRYRYDNGSYLYASTVQKLKSYKGNTLQEKFETCFKEAYGFTEAEVSNVQAINTQSGAVYDFADGFHGDIHYDSTKANSFSFDFIMRNSKSVSSVVVNGVALDFAFDSAASSLTVYGDKLEENGVLAGIGVITFDDGASLRFYIETDLATKLAAEIVSGNFALLFDGAEVSTENGVLTITSNGSFEIPAALAYALYNVGYESVSVTLPAGITVSVFDSVGTLVSQETIAAQTTKDLPLNDGKILFTTESGTLTFSGFALKAIGTSWLDQVEAGDYKAFFGTGENAINQAGDPILNVTLSNFVVDKTTIANLTALGYTHLTFTVDITFADGTTGCYMAIRHGGKSYEQLYPALTAVDGCVKATVTICLDDTTNLQLITRTCELTADGKPNTRAYTAADPDSFIISGVKFSKSGTEGAVDNHPIPDPNVTFVEGVNSGKYNDIFDPDGVLSKDAEGNTILVVDGVPGNFWIKAAEVKKAVDAGYTHFTFTVKVVFPDGSEEAYLCVRANGKKYEQLYSALTTVNGVLYAEVTIPITDAVSTGIQFITRLDNTVDGKVTFNSYTTIGSAYAEFSNIAFLKNGTEGSNNLIDRLYAEMVNGGAYDKLFPLGTLGEDESGNPIHTIDVGNFIVAQNNLAQAIQTGYKYISFKVRVTMPEGVTEGFICVRMNGQKYETKYKALQTTNGEIYALVTLPIGADTTTLQFISRADYTVDGKVNTSSHDQVNASFVFSEVKFLKSGEEGVQALATEKTVAERVVSGEWNLLVSNAESNYTYDNGTIVKNTAVAQLNFSAEVLEELRAAGYTKLTFTMSAEADDLGRIVCRWRSGNSWQSGINKNDLNPATNGKTKTVTFDLTESTCGAGWYIAFQVQNAATAVVSDSTLTLTGFTVS